MEYYTRLIFVEISLMSPCASPGQWCQGHYPGEAQSQCVQQSTKYWDILESASLKETFQATLKWKYYLYNCLRSSWIVHCPGGAHFLYAICLNHQTRSKSFNNQPANLIIKNISGWAKYRHLRFSWTVDCSGGAHRTFCKITYTWAASW